MVAPDATILLRPPRRDAPVAHKKRRGAVGTGPESTSRRLEEERSVRRQTVPREMGLSAEGQARIVNPRGALAAADSSRRRRSRPELVVRENSTMDRRQFDRIQRAGSRRKPHGRRNLASQAALSDGRLRLGRDSAIVWQPTHDGLAQYLLPPRGVAFQNSSNCAPVATPVFRVGRPFRHTQRSELSDHTTFAGAAPLAEAQRQRHRPGHRWGARLRQLR
jgi:hypothetical protein